MASYVLEWSRSARAFTWTRRRLAKRRLPIKLRQWVPSKETRRPRMDDAVLIIQQGTAQQKQAVGKAGRIVQDDNDGQRFKVQLVEGEDPFGEIQGELQELRSSHGLYSFLIIPASGLLYRLYISSACTHAHNYIHVHVHAHVTC